MLDLQFYQKPDGSQDFLLVIGPERQIEFNGKPIDFEKLAKELQEIHRQHPLESITLNFKK